MAKIDSSLKNTQYVAYYRVSTQKQGKSGLGLEAQEQAVINFVGCEDCIINSFQDIESGKTNARPGLEAAIAYAKKHDATLIIAKLDRLSRNAAFIFALKDSGVKFQCADMPDANTLTIGIFATMAQHEREVISKRIKEAFAAKKARGEKLGSDNFAEVAKIGREHAKVAKLNKAKADYQSNKVDYIVKLHREAGKSYNAIATELNNQNIKTNTGKAFTHKQVKRVCEMFNIA